MFALPPDCEDYIQQKIDAGQFHTRDELAVAAIRIYRELEARDRELKTDIEAALDQSRRGQSAPLDIDEIMREVDEEFGADREA